MKKLLFLESLRGLAAVMVVVDHLLLTFFPAVILGPVQPVTHGSLLYKLFFGLPFGFLVNGGFAVTLFFVLSGFVLTLRYFQTKDKDQLLNQGLKRYVRLGIPVAATVAVGLILVAIGGLYTDKAHDFFGISYIGNNWHFGANILQALNQAIIGVLANGNVSYNPVLWSMHAEFIGSFLVFTFCALFGHLRTRWFFYLGAILLSWSGYFLGFFLGVMLADVYANRADFFQKYPLSRTVKLALLAVAAVFASFPAIPADFVNNTMFRFLLIPGADFASSQSVLYGIAAFIVVGVAMVSPRIQRVLSLKYIASLGKHSFSIYLTHFFIIGLLATWVFIPLVHRLPYTIAAGLVAVATFGLLVPISWAWTTYVDQPAVTASRRFGAAMMSLERNPEKLRAKVLPKLAAAAASLRRTLGRPAIHPPAKETLEEE